MIEWEYTPSEFAALLLELRLIKRLRPRFNVQLKTDARHWVFIKLTRGPAPKLQVVRAGKHLVVANQDSDRLTVFRVDHDAGTLSEPVQHFEIGTPMSVKLAAY